MYIFLTYDTVKAILLSWGFDITLFTLFEQCVIFLLSNILFVLTIFLILCCLWKVINRVLRFIF